MNLELAAKLIIEMHNNLEKALAKVEDEKSRTLLCHVLSEYIRLSNSLMIMGISPQHQLTAMQMLIDSHNNMSIGLGEKIKPNLTSII